MPVAVSLPQSPFSSTLPAVGNAQRAAWLTLLLLSISLPGCHQPPPPPPIAEVVGVVTFQGQPVRYGVVIFVSDDGFGASTRLEDNGTFLLRSHRGDGITVGEYSVIITPPSSDELDDTERVAPWRLADHPDIPHKYRQFQTSPLRFAVKEGTNTFEIDLQPE